MKEYSLVEAYHKSLIDLICKLERIMIAVNGFPFEIKRVNVNPYEALTEHEILDKLEKSREHAALGMRYFM